MTCHVIFDDKHTHALTHTFDSDVDICDCIPLGVVGPQSVRPPVRGAEIRNQDSEVIAYLSGLSDGHSRAVDLQGREF